MASVRKPRQKLCASACHPSKTRKTRTQSGRRSRPLLVPFFGVSDGRNALAHNLFSRFSHAGHSFFSTTTKKIKNDFSSPIPNRYHSTSFVKTSAPGGFPSSGTAVLSDFLKNSPKIAQGNPPLHHKGGWQRMRYSVERVSCVN